MEVDRQPSPWPCAAMLVGLLLLCLMAPRYWRSSHSTSGTSQLAETKQQAPRQRTPEETIVLFHGWDEYRRFVAHLGTGPAEIDPLHLWAKPSIEELVAARAGMHAMEPALNWPTIVPLSTPLDGDQPNIHITTPAAPGPLMTATLERMGRLLAGYSLVELMPRLSARVADLYGRWSVQRIVVRETPSPVADTAVDQHVSPSPSTLRLLSPEDRLAMVPQAEIKPINSEPAGTPPGDDPPAQQIGSDPWCVPKVLLDQLRRLARHPASAFWAERTISQLVVLTGRDQLDGNDVQSILEALAGSAQEALQMADETGDDRLRVELLRAHWGLARRLDCWTTLHEIRVAERSRERVALHGPMDSFFKSRTSHTVERPRGAMLMADLETYERSRDPQLGRNVVRQKRALESSADSLDRSLAGSVERHYRNANVRIAITAELLNRMMGQERSEVRALRDRIAGAAVRGRSHMESGSRVRLDPADGFWRLTLEATGAVDSKTLADGGSARLHSHSVTDFAARKSVVVDADGVRLRRTVANATSHNRLVGVTTDFDWLPLVGPFARDRAIAHYQARRERAKAEIEFKVSNEAVAQVDRETLEAVERIERGVRQRFTNRLAEAGVEVTPVEMRTTPERMVARLRVAGDHQLGSHTPRPRALSDSLASVQVHETALTNAAVSLSLDGRRYSGAELQQFFRERFPRAVSDSTDVRRDAVFQFAQEDALQFHIHNGRLELALKVTNVALDGRNMRDFIVHANYVPVVNGLEAELARDDSLGIEGRLSSADRARLHNVFNTVLPPERRLPILRLDNPNDPRLAGLMITQLVLEDGWLGLAIGPILDQRVAERSRSLR